MIYLIALVIIVLIVLSLTYLISKMNDPSGDAQLGLTLLIWFAGGAACIFTISFGIASAITGSWLPGIPLALLIIFIIKRKTQYRK